jgi:hypothetical protein
MKKKRKIDISWIRKVGKLPKALDRSPEVQAENSATIERVTSNIMWFQCHVMSRMFRILPCALFHKRGAKNMEFSIAPVLDIPEKRADKIQPCNAPSKIQIVILARLVGVWIS